MLQPLNTIYYGPPGTGKTYEMLKIADARFTETKATLSKEERIAKIIEDLSWWEVIALCMLDIARPLKVPEIMNHQIMNAQVQRANTKTPSQTVWLYLQNHTPETCSNVNTNKERRTAPFIFSKNDKGFWSIDRKVVEEQCGNLIDALNEYHSGNKLEEKIVRYTFVTFHQSFSYEDFVEGIKPVMDEGELRYALVDGVFKKCCQNAAADPQHDYAIFIDEINRGNVAAIFGELITLIEPDKRKGAKNELATRLPYSKVDFSVPSNLYVIGTMNTADRSIEALDTALRRRFSFKELQPRPELLAEEEFKPNHLPLALDMMLKKINERVEFLLDRDHAIGHSYFLKIQGVSEQEELDNLNRVFRDNIVPLLEEYFYGDLAKVYMILGPEWIVRSKHQIEADKLLFTDNADAVDFNEKYQFKLLPIENKPIEAFLSIL